jgi:hypothetical protein
MDINKLYLTSLLEGIPIDDILYTNSNITEWLILCDKIIFKVGEIKLRKIELNNEIANKFLTAIESHPVKIYTRYYNNTFLVEPIFEYKDFYYTLLHRYMWLEYDQIKHINEYTFYHSKFYDLWYLGPYVSDTLQRGNISCVDSKIMIGGIVVSTDTYMFRPIISKIDYLDELTREELENKLKQLFEHAPKEFIEDVIESIYDKTYENLQSYII